MQEQAHWAAAGGGGGGGKGAGGGAGATASARYDTDHMEDVALESAADDGFDR